MPTWGLVIFGIWLYLVIGYRWGKLSRYVFNNWSLRRKNIISALICFPGNYFFDSRSISATCNDFDRDSSYIAAMMFLWPIKLWLCFVSFLISIFAFGGVSVGGFIGYIIKRDSLKALSVLFKKLFFLEFGGLKSWWRNWRKKQKEKKQAKMLEAHEVHPLQKELDRFQELQKKIPEVRESLRDMEIELAKLGQDLEVDDYRQPDPIRMTKSHVQ